MGRDITRCSEAELRELKAELDRQYAGYVAQNLKLDMSRGKPSVAFTDCTAETLAAVYDGRRSGEHEQESPDFGLENNDDGQ